MPGRCALAGKAVPSGAQPVGLAQSVRSSGVLQTLWTFGSVPVTPS